MDPVDYVHRAGRTARAGRNGLCVSLVTQHDIDRVHAIEAYISKSMTLHEMDEEVVLPSATATKSS